MGAEKTTTDVLCYNLPPMQEQYLEALKRHLGTEDITVTEQGPNDGNAVDILKGPLSHCKVVEIDRTDPEHKGLDGLQEARRDTSLQVRVIAFGLGRYKDISTDVDLEKTEPSAIRMGHGC